MNEPYTMLEKDESRSTLAFVAWHSLFWLVVANGIGVWLALLLLAPDAGRMMGAWSYGRWMPVHLNLQLYGWMSLPLVGWLMKLYRADHEPFARWSRAAIHLWSLTLLLGSLDWLNGHSSGKLFLDWTGWLRVLFPAMICFLWLVLAAAWQGSRRAALRTTGLANAARGMGLLLLLLVPVALYIACSPALYPPVNPDSGGPTGASQLESSLVIVLILFLLPYGIARRKNTGRGAIRLSWLIFIVEALLCLGLGRADVSHHRPVQFLSLASLLVWVPLIPLYFRAFQWPANTRMWRVSVLVWWALLVPSGWALFLPGILDRLKFTDGLVGHSLLAMAGFVTSLLVLLLVALLNSETLDSEVSDHPLHRVFAARWAFLLWQGATLAYVVIMLYAGWIEGAYPAWTMVPSSARNTLYAVRLLLGLAMTLASANWLWRLTRAMWTRTSLFPRKEITPDAFVCETPRPEQQVHA
uniref:Cytochrome oxidase subunit I profile domain-containing protein n=1 Tax=mine drainage metagenome TaxID=410659 RepID=E6PXC9_9ZZZZ